MDLIKITRERSLVFSQTTPVFCENQVHEWLKDFDMEEPFVKNYYGMDACLHFVSFNFSTKHKVLTNKGPIEYQCLKQLQQYDYIYKRLCSHEFTTLAEGFIVFEQTLDGNIHFHALVPSRFSKQCIKAEFLDCFNIKKGAEATYSCNIKTVTDLNNIYEYLFHKQKKKYEAVDQKIFKPLKITRIEEEEEDYIDLNQKVVIDAPYE